MSQLSIKKLYILASQYVLEKYHHDQMSEQELDLAQMEMERLDKFIRFILAHRND